MKRSSATKCEVIADWIVAIITFLAALWWALFLHFLVLQLIAELVL